MKSFLFENKEADNNIVEIFGLAKSGKTTLTQKLVENGNNAIFHENIPYYKKLFFFFKHIFKHPIGTFYLFYKTNTNWIVLPQLRFKDYSQIFLMRNSYLALVLSKYELAEKQKQKVLIDEFLLQSLFMIFHKKTSESEILSVISKMPRSNKILLIEESKRVRDKRFENRKRPARNLNKAFLKIWRSNLEENYTKIRKILFKSRPVQNNITSGW